MKKETFVGIINSLKNASDKADNIENGLIRVLKENKRSEFTYYGHFYEMYCDLELQDNIINTLKEEFNDTDDWIGYFVYELDWGRKYEYDSITDVDGTYIKLASPEDLFDLLTKESKEKNEKLPIKLNDPLSIKDIESIIEKYSNRKK